MPRCVQKKDLSIEELLKYWNDVNFQGGQSKTTFTRRYFLNLTWQSKNVVFECPIGSFTGAHTFRSALAFGKGLDVPYKKILQALSQEDQLVMAMNRKLNWEKRSYNVSHSNESAEIGKSNY